MDCWRMGENNMNLSDYQQYFRVAPDGDLLVRTDFRDRIKDFSAKQLVDLLTIVFFSQADVFNKDALENFIRASKEFGYQATVAREMRRRFESHRKQLRENLRKLYGEKCVICGTNKDLTIDHITSLRNRGTNDISNLQFLCRTCNIRKGAK